MILSSAPHITSTPPPSKKWPLPLVMYETTNMVSTEYIILALLGCLLLAVGLYVLNIFQKKKLLEEGELLERPSFIRKILTNAQDSRSRFDIFLSTQARLGHPIMGCLEELTAKNLTINLGKTKLPPELHRTPLVLYFQLGTGSEAIFYSFTGTLSAYEAKDSGHYITLALPKALSNTQKREFVRITPGPGMVEAVVLWRQKAPQDIQALPRQGQQLGCPDFTYRPPTAAQVALIDISGGGVLLRLAGPRLIQLNMHFAVGDNCCFLILLHDLDTDKIINLWLAGICRRVRQTQNTSNVDVGIQFTHWAQVEKPTQPIQWQAVQRDGEVPPILTWTLRVQTLLTRRV